MARTDYPSDKQDQFMVRFPDGMRGRLKQAAAENKRSMNAEIIARLEATFVAEQRTKLIDLTDPELVRVDELIEWLKERAAKGEPKP